MPRWEYFVHSFGDTTPTEAEQALRDLGQEGWELVTVTPETEREFALAYLKRPMGT